MNRHDSKRGGLPAIQVVRAMPAQPSRKTDVIKQVSRYCFASATYLNGLPVTRSRQLSTIGGR